MVKSNYDIFGREESPDFILCNPSREELYSIKSATQKEIDRRFNALGELTLVLPKEVNGIEMEAYDYLKQKRLILVDDSDTGYFIITDVEEDSDGAVPFKTISALSYEFSLVSRKLSAFSGTYPLWNPLSPSNSTDSLLGNILSYIPNWSIGEVDSELLVTYRTFDVSDANIYEFLTNTVAKAYNCIIIFDNITREISAKTMDNATLDTDVWMSHDNLIKTSSFREISDELNTSLNVTGGGGLSINAVNPLGTNIIYNFDYYKTTEWMTQDLIDALDAWEDLIDDNQVAYANGLTSVKDANGDLIVLNGELDELESEYLALEAVQKARIEAKKDITQINIRLADKTVEIDNKNTEIENKEGTLEVLRGALDDINFLLSFDENFTEEQQSILWDFISENSYNNENILQLDSDTPVEVQELAQTLYDQGVDVLSRVSQPRYEFDIDSVNMLAISEFDDMSSQLQLGSVVHMQNASGQELELVLLEITYNYMSPEKLEMTFSNRLRLDNGAFLYSDLFGQAVQGGTKVKFDSKKWSNWNDDYKDDVSKFITSSLDASKNALINGDSQEVLIYENGLRIRRYDSDDEAYDPAQVWMGNKSIMFTRDDWNTASLAIGATDFNGIELYGVVADAIVGKIIAGNQLSIENENNSFTLDGSGATLTNASFTIQTDSNKNKITLDADVGIKIESKSGGNWSDSFYVNTSGDVIFAGTLSGADGDFSGSITAESGSIGGMDITEDGIDVDTTHYIHNDGEIKWGGLWLKKNGDAQFDGDVYASKLLGDVEWGQIVNKPLPPDKFGTGYDAGGITDGVMSGSRISGGEITWPGVRMFNPAGSGIHRIQADSLLDLDAPVQADSLSTEGNIGVGTTLFVNGAAYFDGGIYVDDIGGRTQTVTVTTPFGTRYLGFRDGIFISYTS